MPDTRFDPESSVTFDLTRGLVHVDGAPPGLLVPADALLAMARAAGTGAVAAFGRSLGTGVGRRAARRLAAGAGAASVETAIEHLGGELALAGLGSLGLERWGQAAVLVIDGSPLEAEGDALIEAVLAGAVEAATERAVHVACIGRDGARARFFLGSAAGVAKVRAWLADGLPWGEALARLHSGRAPEPRGEA